MLQRISSGASGIVEYLETGRKQGREFERDLIDERLTLEGNIDLLDATIESITPAQEGDSRYLHITLGFAEQFTAAQECAPGQINLQTMKEVVQAYREALMAAYDPDEYVFYAEAHVPKVTDEINASTGAYEKRLPHIHIVIPMRNVADGRYLDPAGYGEANIQYLHAIQETINTRFGLKSPDVSRRAASAVPPELGKHSNKFNELSPKQIKALLVERVASGAILSFDELQDHAAEFGAVTVREGVKGAYINTKPAWADKGFNLKEFTRDDFDTQAAAVRAGGPKGDKDYPSQVAEWVDRAAFEARYITSQRLRKSYKEMSPEQRAEYLEQRKDESAGLLRDLNKSPTAAGLDMAAEIIAKHGAGAPKVPTPRNLQQRLYDAIRELRDGYERRYTRDRSADLDGPADGGNRRAATADRAEIRADIGSDGGARRGRLGGDLGAAATADQGRLDTDSPGRLVKPTAAQLKYLTDPRLIVEDAVTNYGKKSGDYGFAEAKDGSPRITHAGKQYNLGDFYTKHIGVSWQEAQRNLESCYAATTIRQRESHEQTDTRVSTAPGERAAAMLRSAGQAVQRGHSVAPKTDRIRERVSSRRFVRSLEAAVQRLFPDRKTHEISEPQIALSPLDAAAMAIERAGRVQVRPAAVLQSLRDKEALQTVLTRMQRRSFETGNTKTVAETLKAAAAPHELSADRLKTETNPAIVLATAARLYGIDPKLYNVGTGQDHSPRIFFEDKQYNLGDFFTKHLQVPWTQARGVLLRCHRATMADALPQPDRELWRQFSQWREQQFANRSATFEVDRERFRAQYLDAREVYREAKKSAQSLRGLARTRAMAVARASRLVTEQGIKEARFQRSYETQIPTRNAHYREYLSQLAGKGEVKALEELRRMAPHESEPGEGITGRTSRAVFPLPNYTVDAKGAVTYQVQGQGAIVKDGVQGVQVLTAQQTAYDVALRVAVARYGKNLSIKGDDVFMKNMLAAARRSGMDLTVRNQAKPGSQPVVIGKRHHPNQTER